jgi:methoxymalonate biosynthesis protein
MSQLSRLLDYGRRFLLDTRFRNQLIDAIEERTRRAAAARPPEEELRRLAFLRGRKLFVAAGCEVTFLLEYLAGLGIESAHSYADGRSMDPLAELMTPGSKAFTEAWDYYLLSVAQMIRLPIQRLQTEGMDYTRAEIEADADAVLESYRRPIALIRERSAAPIFLFSYALTYRPGFGLHEYRSMERGWSLVEFLHVYHLRLYEIARRTPGVYVLDVNLALQGPGNDGSIDAAASSGIFDHLSRDGARNLGRHLVQHLSVLEPGLRRVKCAVFDLDGTLWGGVLREDGPAGVVVRIYLLDVMLLLAARGILLAICSKNDAAELEHLPALLGETLYPKIVSRHLSWAPKSTMLKDIAEELNIGLESLAFFDDSAFERAEVLANAPGVRVFTPDDVFESPNMPEFQPLGDVTREALTRTVKYREQATRREAEQSSGQDLSSFLTSCELRLSLHDMTAGETSRVFELLQRTNQLNATLTRTSLEQLRAYAAEPERYVVRVARLADRFGEYGLIGFAACEIGRETWQLLDLALSCRAAGRGVERALLDHLGSLASAAGAGSLAIRFLPGPRNRQMFEILRERGFQTPEQGTLTEGVPVDLTLPLDAGADFAFPEWLHVTLPGRPRETPPPDRPSGSASSTSVAP